MGGRGSNPCSKETSEFVKAYGRGIKLSNFYQMFKREGGQRGFEQCQKKLQDWYSEASLTCGGKIFKGPDHEGSLPKEYNKMFFCTFCTLIVKLLGPSCLCLSQHWTLLEHARLAWLTFGSRRKKLPEEKNAWAWLTLGSQRKKTAWG